MRVTGLVLAAWLPAVAFVALAEETEVQRAVDLAPPVPITAGGELIDVEGFASPFVGDIDEDGRNDLLVGQYGLGRLRVYRNIGTGDRPQFESFEWFTAAGRVAAVPTCCRVGFAPQLVDFDGDGRTDLLTGSGHAELYLFRRNPDGTFADAEVLENKHGEVHMARHTPTGRPIRYNSTVFASDWDGDRDLDLLLGRHQCILVPNEGTRWQPVFGDSVPLELDGQPIPYGLVAPCVADWDNDGRDDLVTGLKYDIVWYRNIGSPGRPTLAPPEVLVASNGFSHADMPSNDQPAYYHAICITDFNGDGRLDLLLGDDRRGQIELRDLPDADEDELAQAVKTAAKDFRNALSSEYRDLKEQPRNETRQERIQRYRHVLRRWQEYALFNSTTSRVERHGRVWLYERLVTNDRRL